MKRNHFFTALFAVIFLASAGFSDANQRYTVVSGDSLSKIGKRFGVPYREIMAANNLRNTTIYTGQVLVIPVQGSSVEAFSHSYPRNGNSDRFTAPESPGYSETASGAASAPLYRAPEPAPKPVRANRTVHATMQTYTVQSGDTIWSISRKFGVNFWALRTTNDIRFSRIKTGQVLKIPARGSGFFFRH